MNPKDLRNYKDVLTIDNYNYCKTPNTVFDAFAEYNRKLSAKIFRLALESLPEVKKQRRMDGCDRRGAVAATQAKRAAAAA